MTEARRNQFTRLFEAALKKEPSERLAYLDGVSEFDPDLRKEVESLLAAEGKSLLDKTPPAVHSVVPETVEKSTGICPTSAHYGLRVALRPRSTSIN